jgi:hypothetical protein
VYPETVLGVTVNVLPTDKDIGAVYELGVVVPFVVMETVAPAVERLAGKLTVKLPEAGVQDCES